MAASNARRLAALLFIALFTNVALSCAQQRASGQEFEPLPEETATLLQQMTRSAGVIFAGEVISVQRPGGDAGSGQGSGEGVVVIGFRVDAAVRGCTSGSVYRLREWAGLWAGRDRYRVGERLLLFLRTSNVGGLGSPVHGTAGMIPLHGGAIAPGPYSASALAAGWLVDLRWVQAQARRGAPSHGEDALPQSAGSPDRDPPPVPGPEAESEAIVAKSAHQPEPVIEPTPTRGNRPHWQALPRANEPSMLPLARVLSLCSSWARSSNDGQ